MEKNYRLVVTRETRGSKGAEAIAVRIFRGATPIGVGFSYRDSLATAVRRAVRDARATRRFVPSLTAR